MENVVWAHKFKHKSLQYLFKVAHTTHLYFYPNENYTDTYRKESLKFFQKAFLRELWVNSIVISNSYEILNQNYRACSLHREEAVLVGRALPPNSSAAVDKFFSKCSVLIYKMGIMSVLSAP